MMGCVGIVLIALVVDAGLFLAGYVIGYLGAWAFDR
jgi:hypothetical protein